jgi:predicted amidophosphoribosyltransferase
MKCNSCGAQLDFTQSACPRCGAEVELGRLTGILGIVCRSCDAYNEPGTKACVGCGKPLGEVPEPAPVAAPARPSAPAAKADAPAPKPATPPPPPARKPLAPAAPPKAPSGPAPGNAPQPVVRSFQRGGGARVVPPTAVRGDAPIPLVTRCPRCGAEASVGTFCAQCGQALGSRGTQVMAPVGAKPASVPRTYVELAPGRARLVLERGAGKEGEVYRLEAAVTEVGRTRGAILFPEDLTLAPHHASFVFRNGSLHVRDEGAAGGIHLRLRGLSIPLRPGDQLVVGDRLLRYAGLLPPPPTAPPDGTRRLGAPRPSGAAAVLEEVLEGGAVGRVFVRPGPSITIGRTGCAVNLGDDPYLSQAHAEILIDTSGNARLRDLGSSNGTFARLPARTERELRDADVVRMGREVLRVAVVEGAT